MKFIFSELKILPLDRMMNIFSRIPLHEDEVWIEGDFRKSSRFEHSYLAEALSYLPPHIKSIGFSGKFQYDYHQWCSAIAGSHYRSIGEFLLEIVANIPSHVHELKFRFYKNHVFEKLITVFSSSVAKEFGQIFQKLPASILTLDLSETSFDEPHEGLMIQKMYLSIPKTVKKLKVHQFKLSSYPLEQRIKINEYFSQFLQDLSLANMDLLDLQTWEYANSIFDGLGGTLKSLDLSYNRLYDAKVKFVRYLIESIPKTIKHLSLAGNLLVQSMDAKTLSSLLSANLESMDLAENAILDLEELEFSQFFFKFPKLKRLRLFEKNVFGFGFVRNQYNYALLPPHVEILDFSGIEKTQVEFMQLGGLTYVPRTVRHLDLSHNRLFLYSLDELKTLFSHLPSHLESIILANNKFCSGIEEDLASIITEIHPGIKTIALYGNGLDRLPYIKLNKLMNHLPDRVYDFSQDSLSLGHGGQLRSFFSRKPDLYFQAIRTLRSQSLEANYLILITQVIQQKNISSAILLKISEFLCFDLKNSIIQKAMLLTSTSRQVSSEHILKLVSSNLNVSKGGRVDLSRIGLHNFREVSDYQTIFANLPQNVHTLNLRHNQLNLSVEGLTALQQGLKYLPPGIRYLDLSANGFELSTAEELKIMFAYLPATVEYLGLSEERPISLKDTLQRQLYPQDYPQLIKGQLSLEEKLKQLLLNYSQASSIFKWYIYGFWTRQHLPEVQRLVIWMSHGYLSQIQDMLHHLSLISLVNESGSLAKISHFMHREQSYSKKTLKITVMD